MSGILRTCLLCSCSVNSLPAVRQHFLSHVMARTRHLRRLDLWKTSVYRLPHNSSEYARLTPQQVSTILRLNETSVKIEEASVQGFELNQLASNEPIEDRQAEAKLVTSNAFLFGVFDGHAGCACAQAVSERLFNYLAVFLSPLGELEPYAKALKRGQTIDEVKPDLVKNYLQDYDYFNESLEESYKTNLAKVIIENVGTIAEEVSVDENLTSAFMRLDQDLITEGLPTSTNTQLRDEMLQVAFSGACACVAYIKGADLYIANVGDCRAILGTNVRDDEWQAVPLSQEHNADNQDEVQRLISSHPNESTSLIKGGRLLSELVPLRAFGDVRYKWPVRHLKHLMKTSTYNEPFSSYYGDHLIPPNYRTPPYLIAEPEITHHRLTPKDKFLVLATDGLWDMLSPDKVVKLVAGHLDGEQVLEEFRPPDNMSLSEINSLLKRRRQSLANRTVDSNVSTHLLRNALGPDHSRLSALLSLPNNVVRNYRDDISVTVVFFDSEYIRANPTHE